MKVFKEEFESMGQMLENRIKYLEDKLLEGFKYWVPICISIKETILWINYDCSFFKIDNTYSVIKDRIPQWIDLGWGKILDWTNPKILFDWHLSFTQNFLRKNPSKCKTQIKNRKRVVTSNFTIKVVINTLQT